MTWLYVFFGGGLGSVCRYFLAKSLSQNSEQYLMIPYGTFIANLLSCFVLGILIQKQLHGHLGQDQRIFWAIGFCGGFSTFSTFAYELYQYIGRGQMIFGLGYVFISIILGLAILYLGIKAADIFWGL